MPCAPNFLNMSKAEFQSAAGLQSAGPTSDCKSEAPYATCEYLMRRDGETRARECGDAAVFRGVRPPKLFYCQAHGDYVARLNPKYAIKLARL